MRMFASFRSLTASLALSMTVACATSGGGGSAPPAEGTPSASDGKAIRIAAGASDDVTDEQGRRFRSDKYFEGGQPVDNGDHLVLANRSAALYRKSRAGAQRYEIPVDNGRYTVLLHFIESDRAIKGKGQRVFSVDVEGRPSPELDIWHLAAGWDTPLVQAVTAPVTDGAVTITFHNKTGTPVVSGIEIIPSPNVQAALPGSGVKVVFDPAKLGGDDSAVSARCKSDDRSGLAVPGLEQDTGVPGPWALRMDYAVDTRLPYSARAYVNCSTKADLTGMKSLHVWVKPDGTDRLAWLELVGRDGTRGSVGLVMSGTEPRRLDFPLENMGQDAHWYSKPGGANLNIPLKSVRLTVDSAGTLGGGAVYVGAIWASTENASPVAAPAGRKSRAEGDRFVIEDFDNYGSNAELRRIYGFTSHGGMSVVSLDATTKGGGKQGLRLDYSFGKRDHSGLVMFETLDLAPYNVMRLWVRGDGSGNKLRVFDASGGYYQTLIPLSDKTGKFVDLPFSDWIGAPATTQGVIELGFWVVPGSDTNSGTIHIDQIELVKDASKPAGLAKPPEPVKLTGEPPYRIDVGSPVDTKDGDGNAWLSDRGAHWGNPKTYREDEPIDYKGPLAPIFRTERYGMAGYSFQVPAGEYEIRLHFGESWTGAMAAGRRVCTVSVNGTPIRDVDIFAEAGALFTPIVRVVRFDSTDGKIEIGFKDVTNHCKIDGIELVPTAPAKATGKGKPKGKKK